MVLFFFHFLLFFFIFLFLIFAMVATVVGVPSLPTHKEIVKDVIRLAEIKKGDVFMDLGCGTGRVLIAAARQGATAIGWEINPLAVLWGNMQIRLAGVSDKVKIHWGDYNRANFKQADILFLFLMKKHMKALEPKLTKNLKPGTKVFAYIYPFPRIKADITTKSGIYGYKF